MTIHMRQYAGLRDIQPIIDIKGACTTARTCMITLLSPTGKALTGFT